MISIFSLCLQFYLLNLYYLAGVSSPIRFLPREAFIARLPQPLGDLGLDAAKLDYAQLRKVIQEKKSRGPPCPDFELHDNFHHPPNNINNQ